MPNRLSLLDELRTGGFEASLITTFNAYLPFYEEVVLRRLENAGARHNVLMMDARQFATSIKNHPPRLAGRRYTIAPVQVAGAFHPKLILLLGKQKSLIAIGSHNVTLAGFGFNRELSNIIRVEGPDDLEGQEALAATWDVIETWIDQAVTQLPTQLLDSIRKLREVGQLRTAQRTSSSHLHVLGGGFDKETLWSKVREISPDKVTRVATVGAFFDNELRFIRRLLADLKPDRLVVGIDPATVQLPHAARHFPGIEYVRLSNLGAEPKDGDGTVGYLHAKALFAESIGGERIFVSGSANPSSPAWLATNASGNAEIMVARLGEGATAAENETGLTSIFDMPMLTEEDWKTIQANAVKNESTAPLGLRPRIVIAGEDQLMFPIDCVPQGPDLEFALLNEDGCEIYRLEKVTTEGANYVLPVPHDKLQLAVWLRCDSAGVTEAKFLLHHPYIIEEQARTGLQRQFRDALLSLQSDSPNIDLLIECIDKIVFSEYGSVSARPGNVTANKSSANDASSTSVSMSIDLSEIRSRKAKHRMRHSNDFAYLLDALIYHLHRLPGDRPAEARDRFGRTEEEQIDADDDEHQDENQAHPLEQTKLLELCHSKVATIVNRMIAQLRAYANGKSAFDMVLIRLLGVLAVLRELRTCDEKVPWVAKGETTVPKENFRKLFEEVMYSLFEGEQSLWNFGNADELESSDDLARLKGLLIWLAWETGYTLDLYKPFMETDAQQQTRLRRNAMLVALAQTIYSDEVVIDEARLSIGAISLGELEWFRYLIELDNVCQKIKNGEVDLLPSRSANPGDLAFHRTYQNWSLRIVLGSDNANVRMMRLSKPDTDWVFRHGQIGVTRLFSV